MVTITYLCPKCDEATRAEVPQRASDMGNPSVACMHCGHPQPLKLDKLDGDRVTECPICPSTELYVRKDFSQPLGITIIGTGFVLSSIAWFLHHGIWAIGILVATAAADALLYYVTGNTLHCYRCHSELRGLDGLDTDHNAFDLEVHERHRQQAARLRQAEKEARGEHSSDFD